MERRGLLSYRLGVLSLVLFVLGPVAANMEILPSLAGFYVFALGGLLGALGALGGVVASFRGARANGRLALSLGLVPAAVVIWLASGGRDLPLINDITTDLSDPPSFVHAPGLASNRGRDFAYPESFHEIVRSAYSDLEPMILRESPRQVFDRALLVARATPDWEITHVDRDALIFEGVAVTGVFRFRDDFVVRVRREGEGCRVDMRSKSRDGRGDLGANAARIRLFLGKLRAANV